MNTASTSWFAFKSISTKIVMIVKLATVFTIIVASVGIYQMAQIGSEITAIAENDIPLTHSVNEVTIGQLEQAIQLEKILRYGNVHEQGEERLLEEAERNFKRLAGEVDKAIEHGIEVANKALLHARTEAEATEFRSVLEQLKEVGKAHILFDNHVEEITRLISLGRQAEAEELAALVEREEKLLDEQLISILHSIERFTSQATLAAEEHEKSAIWLLTVISVISVVAGITLALVFATYGISRPLTAVTNALLALARGDTSVSVEVKSQDEVGRVAQAFEAFKENAIEVERLRAEAIEEEARIEQEKRDATLRLADELEGTVKAISLQLSAAIGQLSAVAQTMAASATQTRQRASAVAAASEQASANVQTVASAAEELSASIEEISRQVAMAMSLSADTTTQARSSNDTVDGLSASARKIDEVVSLISDIADQTNLLALNATIEAARAGEMGKGFAVVASEVKNLASQTGRATTDIGTQIEQMQCGSQLTAEAIVGVVKAIGRIDEQISGIASAVEEQNAVTAEIARNASEVATGSSDISANIADVSQAASDSSASAEQVMSTVKSLEEQSGLLQSELDRFLLTIRAA